MAELPWFILSLLSREEKNKSFHVVDPLEEQMHSNDIILCWNAAAKLAVGKAMPSA